MASLQRYASPLSAPLSKAVRAGDLLFLSGQTPKNAYLTPLRGDIKVQTENVIETIKASLAEFDLDLSAVIRCTVWLSDIQMMKEFNEVYARHFGPALPVRSTVESSSRRTSMWKSK
ncbi:RidA family protein [Methylobacterium phyllosphaerae]